MSDYVNALADQKRLVFRGDNVIQEGQVPGIESFILGRVAGSPSPARNTGGGGFASPLYLPERL